MKKELSQITCFKCKNKVHYSNDCPELKNENGNGSSGSNKPSPFTKGQVNHVNVEEVYDQPDPVFGKFLLNSQPVLVLFDTGASHSFVSRVVVEKYGFSTKTLSMEKYTHYGKFPRSRDDGRFRLSPDEPRH